MSGRHRKPSRLPRQAAVSAVVVSAGLTLSSSGAFLAVPVTSPADTSPTVALPETAPAPLTSSGVPVVVPVAQESVAVPAAPSTAPTSAAPTSTSRVALPPVPARVTESVAKAADAAESAAEEESAPASERSAPGLPLDVSVGSADTSDVVSLARQYLGTPYVWGGKTERGLDCSGLVYLVLKEAGLTNSYRTSGALREWTTSIPKSQARSGDLVYGPGHVGIYIGNGMMIDAPQPGSTVGVHKVYPNMYEYGRIPA